MVGNASILHVDMDAFYASVEMRDDASLQGKPVVVGGRGSRGVVAAASYEARSYGIHSAMPSARALHLCPHAVFIPARHDVYRQVSDRVHAAFRDITPLVEPVALDEAFLDVAGARRLLGDAPTIAAELRSRLHDELGLWCSVGVAPRKQTAKLASEAAKPRASVEGVQPGAGIVVVERSDELAFLHAHPVGALWGVGPVTRRRLQRLGVEVVGDLAALPAATLDAALGPTTGRRLHALAWAEDHRPVVSEWRPKSVSHEETFPTDHTSAGALARQAVRLSGSVAGRLRQAGLAGRTVQVKVRFADFRSVSRSITLPGPIDGDVEVAAAAGELLATVDPSPGVRLLGVQVSQLSAGRHLQLRLGDPRPASWSRATLAVDEVRRRFGPAAIGPATLVDPPHQ